MLLVQEVESRTWTHQAEKRAHKERYSTVKYSTVLLVRSVCLLIMSMSHPALAAHLSSPVSIFTAVKSRGYITFDREGLSIVLLFLPRFGQIRCVFVSGLSLSRQEKVPNFPSDLILSITCNFVRES